MAKKTLTLFLSLVSLVFIFKSWFIFPFLSAHDWPYFFTETLSDFPPFPPAWAPTLGIGSGGEPINYGLSSFIYIIVSLFVNTFGLPWELIYKVFIFGLFLVLSVFSTFYFISNVFDRSTSFQLLLSTFIFTLNTYILMVLDGGQMGVALAYSISPLVLGTFIRLLGRIASVQPNFKLSLVTGLVLSIQVLFDLRITYITMGIVFFYTFYHYFFIGRFKIKEYVIYHALIVLIVFGFHASWILPMLIVRSHPAQGILSSFNSVEGFRYFSFATFSQSLSLLHPNWPENIFGKVYFMKPEFLLITILAFSSLLLLKGKHKKTILFFALLGLVGAFFAKGANEPFGFVNELTYRYIPGMNIFRDPTKFYQVTILSYIVLIPFSVFQVSERLRFKPNYSKHLILLCAIGYFIFLIRPVFLNQLSGTFAKHEIPQEYVDLKTFLHNDTGFSRTLWVPVQPRYNYYSYMHPGISANRLFSASSSAEIVKRLSDKNSQELLSNLSIRYVIVPYDSFGEIFVKDRKYNENEYLETILALDRIDEFKKIDGFHKIAVYESIPHKDHFWIDSNGSISYAAISPVEYTVKVSISKQPATLIFTDYYSPYWQAYIGDKTVLSRKTDYNTNSFALEKEGTYTLTVYFSKQKYYSYGRMITFLFIVLFPFVALYKRKTHNLSGN